MSEELELIIKKGYHPHEYAIDCLKECLEKIFTHMSCNMEDSNFQFSITTNLDQSVSTVSLKCIIQNVQIKIIEPPIQ